MSRDDPCALTPRAQLALGDMMKAITTGMYTLPAFVSREAKDLVQRMLTVDSKDRITVAQIQRHAWLSQAQQAAKPQRLQKMPSLVCWVVRAPACKPNQIKLISPRIQDTEEDAPQAKPIKGSKPR